MDVYKSLINFLHLYNTSIKISSRFIHFKEKNLNKVENFKTKSVETFRKSFNVCLVFGLYYNYVISPFPFPPVYSSMYPYLLFLKTMTSFLLVVMYTCTCLLTYMYIHTYIQIYAGSTCDVTCMCMFSSLMIGESFIRAIYQNILAIF